MPSGQCLSLRPYRSGLALPLLLPSPSSLCSLPDRSVKLRERCLGKEETLIGELADREDGRLVPQNNHLIGVWMPGPFVD